MLRTVRYLVLVTALAALAGCGTKDSVKRFVGLAGPEPSEYTGQAYPATQTVDVVFQSSQVDRTCRVFAELLVQFPANASGRDVESAVLTEAKARGAHQVLIGQSRQGKENNGPSFLYYGPTYEYFCTDQCGGWKFGFDLWVEQGEWVNIGYKEWGKAGVVFETPLVMQMVMLRCQ
jgi:hypothetical protein